MRRGLIITTVIVIALVAGGFWFFTRGEKESVYRTVMAERTTVKQDVTFTGKLDARQSATLAFEVGGPVIDVLAALGEKVTAGQALLRVDDRLANLELAKARADQDAAENQKEIAWNAAEVEWEHTKAENAQTLEKARQAVRDAKRELDQQRIVHEQVDGESGDSSTTDSTVLALKVKESAYHAAQEALRVAEKTAAKTDELKRGAADSAQAAYLATVQRSGTVAGLSSLEANEELAAVRLSKATMVAPFDGFVTLVDVDKGEYAAAGVAVVKVETVDDLELTADVPETDAAKLVSGAMATVTFDAYGSAETWPAEVVSVAPAAKIISGVPTFEVTLSLISSDVKFKPGLTANIIVHSAQRDNAIAVPRRAVITQGSREFVRVLDGDATREIEVTTGLLGSDGRIEIVSGLTGDEEVIVNGTSE